MEKINMAKFIAHTLELEPMTTDPSPIENGMVWFRSDLNEIRQRVNGVTTVVGKPRNLTNSQMLALSSPVEGQRIWNSTWGKWYTYDGDVWISDGLIKCKNQDTSTMQEGNPVYQDSGSDLGCLLSSSLDHIAIFGVVKDIYGSGATGDFVTVAVNGEHNVLCKGTVNRNQLLYQSTTEGVAESSGIGTPGAFAISRSTRSGGGSSLVKAILQPTERF